MYYINIAICFEEIPATKNKILSAFLDILLKIYLSVLFVYMYLVIKT